MASSHSSDPPSRIDNFTQALTSILETYQHDPSLTEAEQSADLGTHIAQSPHWPALKATLQGYHEDPKVKELHRAIGGYIDIFSQMMAAMRGAIATYFAPPNDEHAPQNHLLLDVLFATMTASPIVESFFGLSTHVGELDADEVAVRNALRRNVDGHLSFRNDLAHADWSIGWVNVDTNEPVPDTAYKIKKESGVPRMTDLNMTTDQIVDRINDLIRVSRLVAVFGAACRDRQRGIGRVSQVLEAVPASASGGIMVQQRS